jgi:phosphoribosylamine---glycine ligase
MGYPRRIMVVGNGGRECALATALLANAEVERLYITPPNWGVVDPQGGARVGVLNLKAEDSAGLAVAAKAERVDLVVIGPEAPLVAGLADTLRSAGIPAVGPGAEAARLEGSKEYAKDFMRRHAIPTAEHQTFTGIDALLSYLAVLDAPCVLKADGLAAGKGVVVCQTRSEADVAAQRMLVQREFGEAGVRVVVEELLTGPELSFTCLLAGGQAQLLGVSTDYKRLHDGQQGPNTGGMGNICPTPYASEAVLAEFHERILKPVLAGLIADGLDYRGFLFIGAMLTAAGLKVLEFNVRLGDPEAQVVLPLLDADWPAVFAAVAAGELRPELVRVRPEACAAVVLASANYPYGKSEPAAIEGFDRVHARGLLAGADPQVRLYFAGVERAVAAEAGAPYATYYLDPQSRFMATGGRVLAISARGADLSSARRLAYEVAGNLRFAGMQYRSDIGKLD